MTTGDYLLFALKLFSALGCGLIAGVFFAFSTFLMKALAQQPPAQGIAAMQSINISESFRHSQKRERSRCHSKKHSGLPVLVWLSIDLAHRG